jgi:lipopolysaccharide transport system permease protein
MANQIQQLFSTRDLIWSWMERTIRGRYQQSLLGWLWAVVQPAASAAMFTVVFTKFVPVDTGQTPYVVFSYVAMVPWAFFAAALTDMTESLVQNMTLVTKIYFPREAIPIATMLARLLDFGVASGLVVMLMFYFGIPAFPSGWLFLPIILALQIALTLGFGLAFAAINIFYRDIQPLLKLGLQLLFYACPIIYPVSLVPETLRRFYFFNPMTGIIVSYRDVLLEGALPGPYLLQAGLTSLAVLILGYWFFKRVEFQFADII